jgi:histidine ammonia-lyase
LLDPAQNNGLPGSLVPNPDGNHYGLMVLRYRAAVLVGEISERAMPAVSPVTAWRVDADADSTPETIEPTPIDALCEALQSVLALERFAAVQALRVRMELLARVHGAGLAPSPGEYAMRVIHEFEGAGLTTVWDGRKLWSEIENVRGMIGV